VSLDLPVFEPNEEPQLEVGILTEMRTKVKHLHEALFSLGVWSEDGKFLIDLMPALGGIFVKTTDFKKIVTVPAEPVSGVDIGGVFDLKKVMSLLRRRLSDKVVIGVSLTGWMVLKYDLGWCRAIYYVKSVEE